MENLIQTVFNSQQTNKYALRLEDASSRVSKLKRLKNAIQLHEQEIYDALAIDLGKSAFESALTEVIFTYGELDFAIKRINQWMKPKRVGKAMSNFFASNRIVYEPKGVCLIIAPWNYPFQLMMSPLISALAAGNCAMLKPSELSPATSRIITKLITETFESKEIACFEGDAETAKTLLELPFDHIFFTGSTAIGKVVMNAAAKNLSSVTLELGGKSPTIINRKVDLAQAAEKIAWGKLINCGQTCIAPDYVFVPREMVDEFSGLYQAAAKRLFFEGEKTSRASYGKIISKSHFGRLKMLLDDAMEKGARLNFGGEMDEKSLRMSPMLLTAVPEESKLMKEEIFGPILPIIPYESIEEVVEKINSKSKPLALYIFSDDKSLVQRIIKQTSAGGTCVNDVLIHISNPKLPFGGVNGSGIGSSHGFHGFKAFSHERSILYQSSLNFNKLVYPPYAGKEWMLKLLRKLM